ncbi:MAG: hypothetical protein QXZ43_01450 [Candidatus Aenigmatarchaeota archaeon]
MSKYTPEQIPADVIACIDYAKNVQEMSKKIDMSIEKLRNHLNFLEKKNYIKKDKDWFSVNWSVVSTSFHKSLENYIRAFALDKYSSKKIRSEGESIIKELPKIFNEKRVSNIFKMYKKYSVYSWLNKRSIEDLAYLYMDSLKRLNTNSIKNFDRKIIKIKKFLDKIESFNIGEMMVVDAEES